MARVDSDVDAWIIVDADSEADPGFARAVVGLPDLREGAAQAYFAISNEFETWLTRLAGILMRIRYEMQFPARARAGLNVPLTGNGMILGARLLERRPWQAFSVTEDWELYAEYTAAGVRVCFCPEAVLRSQEARSTSQSVSQRERWQEGRRQVLRRWGAEIRSAHGLSVLQKLDAHVGLAWPSPALHGTAMLAAAGLAAVGGLSLPGLILLVMMAGGELGTGVVRVVIRHPQPVATLQALLFAPAYAVWRTAVGLRSRFSRAARGEWIRTARHMLE
jgi:hypothetical protein